MGVQQQKLGPGFRRDDVFGFRRDDGFFLPE
jgi:hypothetical protein